jgi:hypothetical protein
MLRPLSYLLFAATLFAQTTTPNLGLRLPGPGSTNWNVPLNANFNQLDLLLSGNALLPALAISGNLTAANVVTTGAYQGAWSSSTAYPKGQAVLYNNAVYLSLVNSNTNNNPSTATADWALFLPLGGGGSGPQPVDIASSYIGQPGGGATILIFTANRTLTIAANFAGSNVTCGTNPTAPAIYTVLKNGTSAGTITLSTACALTGSTSGALTLNTGDRLAITAPNPQDPTAADVAMTIAATR